MVPPEPPRGNSNGRGRAMLGPGRYCCRDWKLKFPRLCAATISVESGRRRRFDAERREQGISSFSDAWRTTAPARFSRHPSRDKRLMPHDREFPDCCGSGRCAPKFTAHAFACPKQRAASGVFAGSSPLRHGDSKGTQSLWRGPGAAPLLLFLTALRPARRPGPGWCSPRAGCSGRSRSVPGSWR